MMLFERYRRTLASLPFPPALEAQFHLQTAESYEALAQLEMAEAAAERASLVAERYGFNHTVFAAEELRARVRSGAPSGKRTPDVPVPDSLKTIATTISEMRRLVPK